MALGAPIVFRKTWLGIPIVGLFFCLLAIESHYHLTKLQKVGAETQAIVLEDRTSEFNRRRKNKVTHRSLVGYVVDNRKYTGIVTSDAPARVGDIVDVFYDPQDPWTVALERVVANESWRSVLGRSFGGILMIVVGTAAYLNTRKKPRKN